MSNTKAFRRKVLLIGIDAYPALKAPLYGCVNDIDTFEGLLLDKLGINPADIQKLTAPHPDTPRASRVPETNASTLNLLNAFQSLADSAQENDRILIYYAGHGCQYRFTAQAILREALVPTDKGSGGRFIWDYELNAWFARIAERGADLTVIFDCCHAASVHRNLPGPAKPLWQVRSLNTRDLPAETGDCAMGGEGPARIVRRSMDTWDPGYAVLAACHADERAYEVTDTKGRHSGELSAALYNALSAYTRDQLLELRWRDILNSIRSIEGRAGGHTLRQQPWFAGRAERFVFGGPFECQDPGFEISQTGSSFRIKAGIWAGFSKGALVAVYGDKPDRFPPIGTPEDDAAHIGLLRVQAESSLYCEAIPQGAAFALPRGARARLLKPADSRLLKIVMRPYQEKAAKDIGGQGSFVVLQPGMEKEADLCFDLVHGNGFRLSDPYDSELWKLASLEPLFESNDIDYAKLMALLFHYRRYYDPLYLVRKLCKEPENLRIRVLDATHISRLSADGFQAPSLPEIYASPDHLGITHIQHGQSVCVAVENLSTELMHVSLLNCTGTGRVELLGVGNEAIEKNGRHIFYRGSQLGQPFAPCLPPGRTSSLDRLVAIGTNQKNLDLKGFILDRTFEEVYRKTTRSGSSSFPLDEKWTGTIHPVLIT